jgi:hypothetical protein
MLTVEEVNNRSATCTRCGGRFRVTLPSDSNLWAQLNALRPARPIAFMRRLRELTGGGVADAKGTMEHIALRADQCHWCGRPMPIPGVLADCSSCGSLNIRLMRQAPRSDGRATQ